MEQAFTVFWGRKSKRGEEIIEAREKVALMVKAAEERKAENLIVMDMQPIASVTDYFVICNGNSNTQIRAIVNGIKESLKNKKSNLLSIEADPSPTWALMDYGDVICHVFDRQTRQFYDLEHLWADAIRV